MTLDLRAQTQTQIRRLSTCHRHPTSPVNGFCASCLRERLAGLDPSLQPESSSSTATAFKSIVKNSGTSDGASQRDNATGEASELRRSKSCSVSHREAASGSSEPRRKSCDVRARKSLQHLFSIDDGGNGMSKRECEVESKNLGLSIVTDPVFERGEDDERRGRRVRVSEDVPARKNVHIDDHRVEEVEEELKTMKEHIDLELRSRKRSGRDLKDIAGSVWVAASVFSKKLQKLKLKQKMKKHSGNNGGDDGSNVLAMKVEKKLNRRRELRETQSEVADYGFGRRSCDTDPRFSVDAARISSDDPRFSFDDYLIARTIPRLTPMLSVVQNAMMAPAKRFDNRVLVEDQMNAINEDETTSGGSGQTRDYCSDSSSSQRRSSFDLASSGKNSTKKALALEVDEVKSVLNTKMSPSTVEIFHGTKLLITDKEFRDLNSKFLKDDQCKSFQSTSKNAAFVPSGGNPKGVKKSNRWRKVWNFLGSSYEGVRENVNERPLEQGGKDNGVVKLDSSSSPKLIRSSSCVGSRSSSNMIGSYNNMRSVAETGGCAKKIREEFVVDRHRSVRYSPSNTDNGLLRFYLTPLRSYKSKSGKSRLQNSNSVARSVFQLN